MLVHFYCPDAAQYQSSDIDAIALAPGKILWSILSARYINLYSKQVRASVSEKVPESGIIIFHSAYRQQLKAALKSFNNKTLVCIIADSNLDSSYADYKIFQNPSQLQKSNDYYLPHWPQPNIIKRDSQRGSRIENIEFKGAKQNLDSRFFSEDFVQQLNINSMWLKLSTANGGGVKNLDNRIWRDFSHCDIQLAVRPMRSQGWNNKPASKLINGWIAEVPSLLGAESAFKYYKKSDLDYIEVSSPKEALQAINKLQKNPNLYADMIANGLQRAKEFQESYIANQWQKTLLDINNSTAAKNTFVNKLPKTLAYIIKKKQG